MRTEDELVASLHERMDRRRSARERHTLGALGALCLALTLCLASLLFGGAAHPGGTAGVYSGAAMLYESAGGYVLTALVAFMLGAAVTTALRLQREKEKREKENAAKQREP